MSLFQNSGKNKKNSKESFNNYNSSCEPYQTTNPTNTTSTPKRRSVTFSSNQQNDNNNIDNSNLYLSDIQSGNINTQIDNSPKLPLTINQPQKIGKNPFYKNFNPFNKASNSKTLFNNDDERLPLKATEVVNQPSVIDRQSENTLPTINNNNISTSTSNNNKKVQSQNIYNSKFSNFFLNRRHSPLRSLVLPIEKVEKLGPQQPSSTALLPKIFGIRHSLTGGTIYVS
uniref:Uncharacterized protein n=1 Tax=Parastrongyloides trichosuri TaxID=131310 RepID=A0A0N5A0D5_PARTI